jgi:Ca-activated chloride channel family protein
MILEFAKALLRPAILFGALAVFLSVVPAMQAQSTKDLPPPPPLWKPKPTPPPKPPEQEVLDVVKVTSNLVMVPVSVTDATGQAIQGLKISDFRLEEEGRAQEIAEIGDPEQVPLDIALLFDVSSSVSQKGFFAFQQRAAATFLREVMKPTDKAAVFSIAAQPTLINPLAGAEVAAARILAIPAATVSTPTAFYDTVIAAAKYLDENSPGNRRRVLIILSDGDDNFSVVVRELSVAEARATVNGQVPPSSALVAREEKHRKAVQEVQKIVLKTDAIFYSVNPGGPSLRLNQISTRAQNGMRTVAEASGGTAFVPDSDKDLEAVFRTVAAELRGQYLLGYYANAETPAGQFRRITVAVPTHQEFRVRARQGYYAKQKQ